MRDPETAPTGSVPTSVRLALGKDRWEELTTRDWMLLVERWAKSARTDLEHGDATHAMRVWEEVEMAASRIWEEMQAGEATVEYDDGHRGDPEREPDGQEMRREKLSEEWRQEQERPA